MRNIASTKRRGYVIDDELARLDGWISARNLSALENACPNSGYAKAIRANRVLPERICLEGKGAIRRYQDEPLEKILDKCCVEYSS
jgi:hypothetical protein